MRLALLTPDDYVALDADSLVDVSIVGHDVDLLFYQVVNVVDDDVHSHFTIDVSLQVANATTEMMVSLM